MLMCRAIANSASHLQSDAMPALLKEEYLANYERILNRVESNIDANLHLSDDVLAKDLGLCTRRLFATGYAIVEIRHSMARRTAMLGGLRQFVTYLSMYYLSFYGKGPFLSNHFHPELSSLFTPEGRIHHFRLVATIMEWRPEFKALVGTAWFYDPELVEISPHLTYIREYPESNGAKFFRETLDLSGNALTSSKRRELHERGAYQPRSYKMVWKRDSMLSWLHREFPSQA